MRRMYRLPVAATPAGSGRVVMRPGLEYEFVPDGRLVEFEA